MKRRAATEPIAAPTSSLGLDARGADLAVCRAAAVGAYVEAVCDPRDRPGSTRRALELIVAGAGQTMSPTESIALVRGAARAAAIEARQRTARRLVSRVTSLVLLRRGCARTPRLLGARADGGISPGAVAGLYRHLDRCRHCAAIAGHFDAAEWALLIALTSPAASGSEAPSALVDPAPAPDLISPVGLPDPIVRVRADIPDPVIPVPIPIVPDPIVADPVRVAAPFAAPVSATVAAVRTAPALTGRSRRWWQVGVAIVLAAAAGIVIAATRDSGDVTRAGPTAGAPTPGPQVAAPAPKQLALVPTTLAPRSRGTSVAASAHGVPFIVGKAKFAVFAQPHQGWASFVSTAAGPGLRWEAVTVRIRNLGTPAFDPRVLSYRLVDPSGTAYAPDPAHGTAAAAALPPQPVALDGLVEARLGFLVPVAATGLQLRFRATRGGPAIVVALDR